MDGLRKRRMNAINDGGGGPLNTLKQSSSPAARVVPTTSEERAAKRPRYSLSAQTRARTVSESASANPQERDPYQVESSPISIEEQGNSQGRKKAKDQLSELWTGTSKSKRRTRGKASLSKSLVNGAGQHACSPPASQGNQFVDLSSPPPRDLHPGENDSPSPANIVSDVLPSRGRPRKQHTAKPVFKDIGHRFQPEPIMESEDELQQDVPIVRKTRKQPVERPGAKRSRAPQEATSDLNGSGHKSACCRLLRATSGEYTYDHARKGETELNMRLRRGFLEPWTPSGKLHEHNWLDCDLKSVIRVKHAAMRSRYLLIERPQSGLFPSKVFLEFETNAGAAGIVECVDLINLQEVKDKNWLEKAFEKSFDVAIRRRSQRKREKSTDLQTQEEVFSVDKDAKKTLSQRPPWSNVRRARVIDQLGSTISHDRPQPSALETNTQSRRPNCSSIMDISEGQESLTPRARPDVSRRRRSASPPRFVPPPKRWSEDHPGWHKRWSRELVYPFEGKNRTSVEKNDIPRLDEEEWFNDNLINFYLRFLQVRMEAERPELKSRVYFFNTFFFTTLRSTKPMINYNGVKNWTSKVDLFSYDYVIIPVNEHGHWYLVLVVNLPTLITGIPDGEPPEVEIVDVELPRPEDSKKETRSKVNDPSSCHSSPESAILSRTVGNSPQATRIEKSTKQSQKAKKDFPGCKIIALDSMGSPHSPTVKAIREYLHEEAHHKKGMELRMDPQGQSARQTIPQQPNWYDCGVYILRYVDEFLKDPDTVVKKLVARETLDWSIQPTDFRASLRDLLFGLQGEQEENREQERIAKKGRRQKKALDQRSPVCNGLGPGPAGMNAEHPSTTQGRATASPQILESAGPMSSSEQDLRASTPRTPNEVTNGERSRFFVSPPRGQVLGHHSVSPSSVAKLRTPSPAPGSHEEDAMSHNSEGLPNISSEPRFVQPLAESPGDTSPGDLAEDKKHGTADGQGMDDDTQPSLQILGFRKSPEDNASGVVMDSVEPAPRQTIEMEVDDDEGHYGGIKRVVHISDEE